MIQVTATKGNACSAFEVSSVHDCVMHILLKGATFMHCKLSKTNHNSSLLHQVLANEMHNGASRSFTIPGKENQYTGHNAHPEV